jgi:hypothetical protein
MYNEKIRHIYNNFLVKDSPSCIGNSGPPKLSGTRKVVQLTGDTDRETGRKTPNQTGSLFGIYGTDLGVSFLHDGKLYFHLVILTEEKAILDCLLAQCLGRTSMRVLPIMIASPIQLAIEHMMESACFLIMIILTWKMLNR